MSRADRVRASRRRLTNAVIRCVSPRLHNTTLHLYLMTYTREPDNRCITCLQRHVRYVIIRRRRMTAIADAAHRYSGEFRRIATISARTCALPWLSCGRPTGPRAAIVDDASGLIRRRRPISNNSTAGRTERTARTVRPNRGNQMQRRIREIRNNQSGFTLIELLIVIVILGILAAIVVFAVERLQQERPAGRLPVRLQERRDRRRGLLRQEPGRTRRR